MFEVNELSYKVPSFKNCRMLNGTVGIVSMETVINKNVEFIKINFICKFTVQKEM